jgi:hypothetical protein
MSNRELDGLLTYLRYNIRHIITFFVFFISIVYQSFAGIIYLLFLLIALMIDWIINKILNGKNIDLKTYFNNENYKIYNLFVASFTFFYLFFPAFLANNVNYYLMSIFLILIVYELSDFNRKIGFYYLVEGCALGISFASILLVSPNSDKTILNFKTRDGIN